jgi:hypothetical protein
MIKGAVNFAMNSLNQLPAFDGISTIQSPKTSVTGSPPLDNSHFKLEFGEYILVYESNTVTNTNAPRMIDTITLHYTRNLQGSYNFMSIQSGKRIARSQYTRLPLTQRAIDAVNALGQRQKQPLLPSGGPKFVLHNNEIHKDIEETEEINKDETLHNSVTYNIQYIHPLALPSLLAHDQEETPLPDNQTEQEANKCGT